jgi:hypothetical protein
MFKILIASFLLVFSIPSFAIGMTIALAITGATLATAGIGTLAIAFAVNMIVSTVVSKVLYNQNQPANQIADPSVNANLGNRQQLPPATDNKLPIIYGTAYVGGQVIDLSISNNNQELYYVMALSEVTGTESGQTTSTYSFGKIYWGGKLVNFQGNGYTVASLTDESTGVVDTTVDGLLEFYLYSNGSNNPINSPYTAIQVMSNPDLIYQWDNTKLMSNCVFAIIHLTYNQPANITGLQQTKFQINNSLKATGDVIYDYLINTRYGGAIPQNQIDIASLNALTAYSEQVITYTTYSGGSATQKRFEFNGILETTRTIMQNLQDMSSCCDCLIKYSEMYGTWGVIVQKPDYDIAMELNDSNIISAFTVSLMDIANSFNIAEVKFPDNTAQDSFNTSIYDLAEIDPALLYPNEPVNKQSISLPLTNNSVTAQLLANRFLKSAREDLQLTFTINYIGLQLDAGDIVTITNINYGWVNKLFRCQKVTQSFSDNGQITTNLLVSEFNPEVYNDVSITQFTPAPNTGIGNPTFFGIPPAPIIIDQQPFATNPYIELNITTSTSGIAQYAEVWYSAFSNPTSNQRIFAGTTAIQSNGNPYSTNTLMPPVILSNIASGNWYFFSRMVNSLASSVFSPASNLLEWRPVNNYQYSQRYLSIAYADDITGTGFSYSPTNKTYYGIVNEATPVVNPTIEDYTWYEAYIPFGTTNYLLYNNIGNKRISFSVGIANISAGGGAFVPSDTSTYDPSIWLGLPDGRNIIDLNFRTGQVLQTGTTTVGTGELAITNNPEGLLQASLAQLLTFPNGATTFTSAVVSLTVDRFGRVIGFVPPDSFYYTMTGHIATSGQTVFNITRGSEYLAGNSLVFQNGCYLNQSEWTDGSNQITLAVGANLNDTIVIISMASVSASTSISYNSFSINSVTLTNQSNYTASGFTLVSGYELLFLNGTVINAQDYNIAGQTISFNTAVSGDLQVIQWTNNNQSQPNGNPQNTTLYTIIGQATYPFTFNPLSFNLYNNGVLLLETVDYTVTTGSYTLSQTPTSTLNILVEQTFNRTGAV